MIPQHSPGIVPSGICHTGFPVLSTENVSVALFAVKIGLISAISIGAPSKKEGGVCLLIIWAACADELRVYNLIKSKGLLQ
jgi:hypothetical protein